MYLQSTHYPRACVLPDDAHRASLVSLPSPAEAPVPKPGEKPIWVLGSPPDQDGSIEEAVVIDSFFGEGDTP